MNSSGASSSTPWSRTYFVKRYAFDPTLLAVANDSGFGRIGELPVRLDHGFSESGLDLLAVAQALLDTAAIFYRLRIP